MKKDKLVFNVYEHDTNSGEFKIVNILRSGGYMDEQLNKVVKQFKKDKKEFFAQNADADKKYKKWVQNYKETFFKDRVMKDVMYMYWSRCEFEIVLATWPTFITCEEVDRLKQETVKYRTTVNLEHSKKIDIYDQVKLNEDLFINYLWDNLIKDLI